MRVLIAFDKFKDSLTAPQACAVAAETLQRVHPDWEIDLCPLADGGEGFCRALTHATDGTLHALTVTGPRGQAIDASFGLVSAEHLPAAVLASLESPSRALIKEDRVAVVEMASASGLALLAPDQRDAWHTTTFGTGELIRAAAASGAHAIVLGVGGSATHDAGLGALCALGLQCLNARGERVEPPTPGRWPEIVQLAGEIDRALPPIFIACDVINPLLGPRGAAAVYAPQKGVRADDIAKLDHETARVALLLCAHCGQPDALMDAPGAGAAGGIAFGLMVAAQARLLPGFDLVSRWLDLERRIASADVVVTGEGRFDDSSLSGKGPAALAARSLALSKPVHLFAGTVQAEKLPAGLVAHAITPAGQPLDVALRDAAINLRACVANVFG